MMDDALPLFEEDLQDLQDLQDLGLSLIGTATLVQNTPLHNIPAIDPRPHEPGIPNTTLLVMLLYYTVNL